MKKLLLIYLLAMVSCYSYAQTAPAPTNAKQFKITGSVADSASQKKLDFITLNLMKDKNTVVKAGYTKEDGSFEFSGLNPSKYVLLIAGVGYKSKTVMADLSDTTKKILDLGPLFIREDAVGLKEVKVSATKQIVKQEVDRISYDLQADPESKVFNVLDMMRKVPYLSLDAEDNIQLKGNSDFRILINGKPSSMVERSYKDVLRSMPASSILRIEVITTPPSKYDAEGLSGIINIITNKAVDNGYNGSINVSERFPVGGPGFGGSLSAKLGKWGISAFGGGNQYNNPETTNMIDRATFGETSTLLTQRGFNKSASYNGYLGLEISYELDSLNLISGQFNINGNKSDGTGRQSSLLDNDIETLQGYNLNNKWTGNGTGADAALNYQLGFKKDKNRLLTFSYRYFGYDNGNDNITTISNRVRYDLPNYRQLNDQRFSEQTLQVDYVYPVKKLTIEAGLKGILRKNESDFEYRTHNSDSEQYEVIDFLSNSFSNTQNIYGIYNTYGYNFKKWGIKGGVRVEQTVLDVDFESTNSKVNQNYFNVIPTLTLNRKLKKGGINFGYTQRIRRPGIYQLNPFVDRSNPSFERTGNPDLKPSVMNEVSVGFNWSAKTSYNLSIGHTFIKDMFFPVIVFDPVTKITRSSFGNVGKAKLLPMANLNINHPITKKWNLSINSRLAYAMTEGMINGKLVKNKGLMYGANISSGYRLEKNWRLNANVNFNGPGINIQERTNTYLGYSLSVNKDVIKDKLSFSASFNNPFNKYRKNIRESFGPDFLQNNERRDYFRSFNVSMNYKFGKLKESIKKNKRGIRNDDVQSGD